MRNFRITLPPMSIKSRLLIFLVPSILILFGISIIANLKITEKTVLEHTGHEAYYSGLSLVNEMEIYLQSSQEIAEGMALTLEVIPELEDVFIKKLLKINVEQNPYIYGSTISLSPDATGLGNYAPYYYRNGKEIKYKSLSSPYYDYKKWDWFRIPMETGKGSWGEPYYDEGGGNIHMVTYSVPIFRAGRKIGVATADIGLDNLIQKVQSLRVDNSGYALLLSDHHYIIAHPDKRLLLKKLSPDRTEGFKKGALKELYELMNAEGIVSSTIIDPFTGKESWIIAMPIKSAKWTLGIVYPYNEILRPVFNVQYVLGVFSLVIAALMVILILWISASIASPVSNLVKQTRHYAEGDFDYRLDEAGGFKEIQELSYAFNIMGEAIDKKIEELRDTQKEIVFRLARAAEYRDNDTGMHIKRMSHYCAVLGRAFGLNDEECDILLHASSMHDIGKIGIADAILLKKGKLEPDEWRTMQTHVQIGEVILSGGNSRLIQMAQIIASTHHEHWDGSGYPRGIKGEEIPITGRITCICDVFDSLTSERPYKNAWTVEEALNEIKINSGKIFDPYMVELFIRILPDIIDIKDKFIG
ncbi:MAG: cache domain-containing protein [Proteobacteria bacterium]|nr:cache domain-containing protein [Pseudomonadota bacterium]